jgi:DNA polymerase-3 subunit delta
VALDALDEALADIKAGKVRPFYVVHGEEFLARRAVEALCDALVPKQNRELNLTTLDGSVGGAAVGQQLDTVPMFRGTKVVFVDGADALVAKRDIDAELAKARELWALPNRRKDAVRRVLSLVSPAGWTWRELDPEAPGAPPKTRWKKEVGFEPSPEDRTLFAEMAAFAADNDLKAPRDELDRLLKSVNGGPPKGNHLILLCQKVDPKHPLVLAMESRALFLQRAPERDFKKRGIEGLDIGDLCREVLEPLGKRLTPGATHMLKDRVGDAMRLLAGELEKLAIYVGPRPVIEESDVERLVAPLRAEDFFELGNAIGDGNAGRAMKLVEDELNRGKPPLMLFGGLVASVRRLAVDAARFSKIPGALTDRRELSYNEFQSVLFQPYLALCIGDKEPKAFPAWLGYKRARRIGLRRALRALALAAEIDLRLKRGGNGPLELERLILAVCG